MARIWRPAGKRTPHDRWRVPTAGAGVRKPAAIDGVLGLRAEIFLPRRYCVSLSLALFELSTLFCAEGFGTFFFVFSLPNGCACCAVLGHAPPSRTFCSSGLLRLLLAALALVTATRIRVAALALVTAPRIRVAPLALVAAAT